MSILEILLLVGFLGLIAFGTGNMIKWFVASNHNFSSFEEINKLYKGALSDPEFKANMKEADDDEVVPTSDNLKRHIIAITYYGWLVGRVGSKNWRNYIRNI